MDKATLLDRHYTAFIDLGNDRDFFLGLRDYFDLINADPGLTQAMLDISGKLLLLDKKIRDAEDVLMNRLKTIKGELATYVSEHKLDEGNTRHLKEYLVECDGLISGRIILLSTDVPFALGHAVRRVIDTLYHMPEHSEFASQYIVPMGVGQNAGGQTALYHVVWLKEIDALDDAHNAM